MFAYESTLRVPLIITQLRSASQLRNTAAHGIVSSFPARHIDIVPSMLDAVQIAAPSSLRGGSLLPGASAPADPDASSYFEAMSAMLNRGWAPLQGVIARKEKFVDLPIPELYDLAADPLERTNLIDRRSDRRRALEARLQDLHAAPPGARSTESPEVAAQLRSLGYVSGSAAQKAHYTEADDPKNLIELDQWIQQGIEAWQLGRHDEANAIYERIIQTRPTMPIGYRNLALLEWQSGDAARAIHTLERAFHVQFELTPGTYLMRTVVREPGGTIGSADRRLEVRPFSGPDLSVSDLVLGSATGSLPVRAQAYSEDGLAGMLEAYARAGDQLQRLSITVTLVPAGSDQPVATVQGTLSEAEAAGGGILRRVTFSLPLTEVPPGAYIARVRVRSGDEAVADLSRDVDVHPGSAPAPSAVAERELPKPSDVLEGDFVKSARMQLRQVTTPAAIHAVKGFDLFARADYPAAATELSQAMDAAPGNGVLIVGGVDENLAAR